VNIHVNSTGNCAVQYYLNNLFNILLNITFLYNMFLFSVRVKYIMT
jgi:hypothetical protein